MSPTSMIPRWISSLLSSQRNRRRCQSIHEDLELLEARRVLTVTTSYAIESLSNLTMTSGTQADATVLADGRVAVVKNGISGVTVDHYRNSGNAIAGTDSFSGRSGSIVQVSGGNTVVAFNDFNSVGYRIMDPNGNTIKTLDFSNPTLAEPEVVALPTVPGFCIVHKQLYGADRNLIELNFFDSNGDRTGTFFPDNNSGNAFDPAIATLDNGNIAVVWVEGFSDHTEVWTSVISPNGNMIRTPVPVDNAGINNLRPDICAIPGGYAVVFMDDGYMTGADDINISIHDNEGNRTGFTNVSNPSVVFDGITDTDPTVTHLGNGIMAVGYTKQTTSNDSDSIVVLCQARPGLFGVEILAQRGGTADTIIKGRRDASDITSDMTMAGTFYGGLYVLHTSRSLSLGNDLAGERLFVYRDSTGGFDNETIQGDLMADRMYGNGGSDTLRGNGGPDLLSGGLGNDILDGGQGTDILTGDAGADTLLGGQGADRLHGGEGVDVVNYGTSPGGVKVNFFTGMGSGGDATGDSYNEIENVVGSNFADVLTGTFSSNSMVGGGGADQITGEYGSDRLTGGRGADRFIYREVGESVSGNRDVIMDFRKSEGDKIQISAIDGKASTTAMNSFRLLPIGSNFTAEGQIRVAQSGAHTIIYFNTIGASGAEMEIQLSNFTASTLTQSDFITGGWLSGFAERTAAPRSAAGGISENPTSGLRSTWVGLNFSSPVTGQDAGTMTQSIRKDSVVASSSPTMEKYSTTLATQSSVDAFPVTADVQFATDLAGIDSVFSELDDVL